MQPKTDAQMKTFTVDTHQLRRLVAGQARQRDIVRDSRRMVAIHVLKHADFSVTGKGIGETDLIQPVDRPKAPDIPATHGLQAPEIKVMGLVITTRVGEVAVITRSRRVNLRQVTQLPRLSEKRQTSHRLHVLGTTLADQQ